MYRNLTKPRKNWRKIVEGQGLVFPTTHLDDGSEVPYWFEGAYYELSGAEVEQLEDATERLHSMSLEAAKYLLTGELGNLGLPKGALAVVRENMESDPPSIYGRFDVAYDGMGPPKLLEYNADTPTSLIESSVCQWYWLDDKFPNSDQFNSLHERLVNAWAGAQLRSRLVHFAHSVDGPHEDWITTAYMRDTAAQAGLATVGITMEDVGWDAQKRIFVDNDEVRIDVMFKLYPWEDMLHEPFGRYVLGDPELVQWIEPLWKTLLSNKMLLVALWRCFPDHELLLPAFADSPGDMEEWVAKPLHGREGEGVIVHSAEYDVAQPPPFGRPTMIYQQYCPMPRFDGNHAVVGLWVVEGKPAGVGIRESDGPITDTFARFLPHVMSEPRPDDETMTAWLNE